jgi:hypothetical protein
MLDARPIIHFYSRFTDGAFPVRLLKTAAPTPKRMKKIQEHKLLYMSFSVYLQ